MIQPQTYLTVADNTGAKNQPWNIKLRERIDVCWSFSIQVRS